MIYTTLVAIRHVRATIASWRSRRTDWYLIVQEYPADALIQWLVDMLRMPTAQTLRDVADAASFGIGAAVSGGTLRTDPHYRDLLRKEFNVITTENALKMGPLRPEPGVYEFSDADAIVNFGTAYDMDIRGHTLVWHNQQPDWFRGWERTPDQVESFLREHVYTVAGRYRGRIDEWDVVNEAVLDDGSLRETVWYDAIGEEYLDAAFSWADEVSDADLYYNDYGAEEVNDKSDGIYRLIGRLLDRDVPVDGIGFQMHALHSTPDLASVAENVRRFQKLGLEVAFTEVDVAYQAAQKPDDHRAAQAEFYADLTALCVREGIDTMVTWGVRDTDSWVPGWFPDLTDDPLLFDGGSDPKPAYYAVYEALSGER